MSIVESVSIENEALDGLVNDEFFCDARVDPFLHSGAFTGGFAQHVRSMAVMLSIVLEFNILSKLSSNLGQQKKKKQTVGLTLAGTMTNFVSD